MSHESDQFAREVERRAAEQRLDVFLSSRDGGHTLTQECLDSEISARSLVDVARNLADYADEAIGIVRDEYRPQLDCKAGCSYCCRKPGVLIAIPDLLRILDHVHALDGDALDAVRRRARLYADRLAGR